MNKLVDIAIRYVLLLLLGLGSLFVFYYVFTPLTIYPSFYVLGLFYDVFLYGITISTTTHAVEIVRACVAGAAYYLLTILNLATPMKLKKRLYLLVYSFAALLVLNVARIVILSIMFFNDSAAFDATHRFTWYGLSTLFVVAIWFFGIYIFKIKEIPGYTDVKTLWNLASKK